MHEMGLAQAILDTALEIAGERPVLRVAVSAGEQLAVSDDSLTFSFGLLTDGTGAAEAVLELHSVPGERLLIDEVEVGGPSPEVLRRTDTEVTEAPHEHSSSPSSPPGEHPVHPAWL
ncbi:MAG: hydrogenase/urease maturation nickel metallochaperone HypA [Candidatus Dormibacteraeota bacterium]|nr:hydrogenase/urease maturation nickel metallochaperone HypA [Candidatus Dormibacteraeota bacterium]